MPEPVNVPTLSMRRQLANSMQLRNAIKLGILPEDYERSGAMNGVVQCPNCHSYFTQNLRVGNEDIIQSHHPPHSKAWSRRHAAPPFPDGFHGNPIILEQLDLECREDDGVSIGLWESATSPERQYPELASLGMVGRIYYNTCRRDPKCTTRCAFIQHLTPPFPGESFNFILPELDAFDLPSNGLAPPLFANLAVVGRTLNIESSVT